MWTAHVPESLIDDNLKNEMAEWSFFYVCKRAYIEGTLENIRIPSAEGLHILEKVRFDETSHTLTLFPFARLILCQLLLKQALLGEASHALSASEDDRTLGVGDMWKPYDESSGFEIQGAANSQTANLLDLLYKQRDEVGAALLAA